MPITLDTHLSLFSIPVVFVVGLVPHVQKISLISKSGVKHSNIAPRETVTNAEKKGLPAATLSKIHRLAAAHENALENFPVYVSALFAGYAAGLDARTLNVFSLAYIATRVAYNVCYANQTTEAVAGLRSLSYWIGTGWSFYIMGKAAFVVMNRTS